MTKIVKFRLSDEDFSRANEIAVKHNKSVHELAKDLLVAYLKGARDLQIPEKVIPKRFRARKELKCSSCREKIKPGEWAYYVEYEYSDGSRSYEIHHASCWEYASDEALARVFKEKRKLQRIIRALRKEANELADVIEEARAREKIMSIALEIQEHVRKYLDQLSATTKQILDYHVFTGHKLEETKVFLEDLRKTVIEFTSKANELSRKLEEASIAITLKLKKVSKKARE